MLQPDAFCEHKSTMQQNATADRGLRWGSLQRSHRPFSWIKGRGMGKEERGRKGRREGWLWCVVGTGPPTG